MAPISYEINRLSSEELTYELAIRGITEVATVELMRKTLRNLLKLEREGQSLDYPSYPFTVEEDIRELQKKYSEMNKLLIGFDGADQNTYRKLLTKYAYALGRVNRLLPTTADEKSQKSKLLVEILNFKSDLDRKVKSHERASLNKSQGVLDLSLLKSGSSSSDNDSLPDDDVLSPPKKRKGSSFPVFFMVVACTLMA
ncbi:hypothetical protein RN001_015576 [Aquatica leii]|uniref:Uncharacterized protein n=1 Tax=Aquatica leii TaxID=1421715 RepID=A0AAN7PR05_9COLE|nr:hypothetical protein RN001_015576 [Aquatica leii]